MKATCLAVFWQQFNFHLFQEFQVGLIILNTVKWWRNCSRPIRLHKFVRSRPCVELQVDTASHVSLLRVWEVHFHRKQYLKLKGIENHYWQWWKKKFLRYVVFNVFTLNFFFALQSHLLLSSFHSISTSSCIHLLPYAFFLFSSDQTRHLFTLLFFASFHHLVTETRSTVCT
jgi:hypothetical protein